MKKLSRRGFLISSAALLAGGGLATFVSWKTSKETDILVAILKHRLGTLDIEAGAFEKFSIEAMQQSDVKKKELKLLGTFSAVYSVITPYSLLPIEHPLRRLENSTVSNFLLSTDFFQNKADTTRKVKYLGFYDPYNRPCTNFFNHG